MGSLGTGRHDQGGMGEMAGWKRFVVRYITFVTDNPVKVLVGSIVLAVLLIAGMSQLTFRSDNRVFFADDNPELQQLARFEQLYGRDDNLIYVVKAKEGICLPPNG
jgi:predicted RND superfamily exporter protein